MKLLIDIWEFFFPRYCVVCGKRLLLEEEFLCLECLCALPRTRFHMLSGNEIEKSLWGKFQVERASAFLYYAKGGDVRKLLYELKYYGNRDIGVYLGKCMAEEMLSSGFFNGVDCIVPVPLHLEKLSSRGYNQSEALAEGLSAILQVPVCRGLLRRTKYTETQTHKNNFERWENVKDVFEYIPLADFPFKHVLLVDDVLTTGATLVACADALGQIEGLHISVLVLAWAADS